MFLAIEKDNCDYKFLGKLYAGGEKVVFGEVALVSEGER